MVDDWWAGGAAGKVKGRAHGHGHHPTHLEKPSDADNREGPRNYKERRTSEVVWQDWPQRKDAKGDDLEDEDIADDPSNSHGQKSQGAKRKEEVEQRRIDDDGDKDAPEQGRCAAAAEGVGGGY